MRNVNFSNLEFNPPSPVKPLLKSIDLPHARLLLDTGEIRLHIISYYRDIEDEAVRDQYEGIGIINCRGNPVRIQGLMDTFVWCTSQAQVSPQELAKKYGRSAVLILNDPFEFARRLITAAYEFGSEWSLQCCPVVYDKRSYRDRNPEDDHDEEPSEFYVFQKDASFSHETEYRFALTDLNWRKYKNNFLTFKLRPCADIMEVREEEKIPTTGASVS